MKTILLTGLICVTVFFGTYAQWTTVGNNVYTTNPNNYAGLGTTSPQSLLHLNQNSSDILRIQNPQGGLGNRAGIDFSTYPGSGKVARIEAVDVGAFNGDMVFLTDGDGAQNSNVQERMRISSSGYVGIGVSTPAAKLHINSASPSIRLGSTAAAEGFVGEFGSITFTRHYDLIASAKIYSYANWNADQYAGADLRFATSNNNSSNEGLTDRMRILPNGNVGIGTATPGSYRLAVAGKIAATGEVRVFTAGTTVFPDYVFEPDYDLPSLEETENFIKENKHLPEVPSATEIDKDGMSLNDMNVILLKKVEELTLHLIQMKKEIDELKKKQDNK